MEEFVRNIELLHKKKKELILLINTGNTKLRNGWIYNLDFDINNLAIVFSIQLAY